MGKSKRPKFEIETAELLWEYHFKGVKTDTDYVIAYYRDKDGLYWEYITWECGKLLLDTQQLIDHMFWFYAAYSERGDLRSSNDIVVWKSERYDINDVIAEVCDPANCARYHELRLSSY